MSIVRESSPTSKPKVAQGRSANNLPGVSHNPTKQLASNNGGRNQALAAATFSGTGKQRTAGTSKNQMYDKPPMPYLSVAPSETNEKNSNTTPSSQEWKQSTPQIAALIAVRKYLPVQSTGRSPNPPPRRMNLQKTLFGSTTTEMQTDKTPIPATNSLIKLFESQTEGQSLRFGGGLPHPQTSQPKIERPKPARSSRTRSVDLEILRVAEPGKHLEKTKTSVDKSLGGIPWTANSSKNAFHLVLKAPSGERSDEPTIIASRRGPAPLPPPPKRTRIGNEALEQDRRIGSTFTHSSEGNPSPSSYTSAVASLEVPARDIKLTEDIAIAKVYTSLSPNPQSQLLESPSVSPSTAKSRFEKDDHLWVGRQYSHESTLDPRSRKPQLTANSLANAIVASSLASSRASSPSKPAPPLPRRQSKAQSIFRRSQSQELVQSRTPSPGRVMRQTMRETPKSDEEVSRKRTSGNILNKHPNKHREGDRKRWRDEIAERERKRYEGVWAANKGLLVPSELPDSNSTVLNLVVRDIWCRSRLPKEVLGEVWDLVDNSHVGRLSKEEFVVGMWLIDQRLKGRKLPVKVSESVWFSVKRLSGLKAPR